MSFFIISCIGLNAPGSVDNLISERLEKNSDEGVCYWLLVTDLSFIELMGDDEHSIVRNKIIKRVQGCSIKIVFFDRCENDYIVFEIHDRGLEKLDCEEVELESVRAFDLKDIAAKYSEESFLSCNEQYHFVTPSHKHTNVFFRLSDSIKNRDELDRLAFWILIYINSSDYLFIDSWTIAAIPLRAMQLLEKTIPFDALPAHPARHSADCSTLVSRNLTTLQKSKYPLLLISVVSSGAIVKKFKSLYGDITKSDNLDIAAFYSFEDREYSLCQLEHEVENYDYNDCVKCQANSTPVEIHPSSYYVKDMRDSEVIISQDIAARNKKFLERYFDNIEDIVAFHKGDRAKNKKHYAFYVDYSVLSETDIFKSGLEGFFSFLGKKGVVFSPVRDSVTSYLEDVLGYTLVKVSSIDDIFCDENSKLFSIEIALVFYDPVVISGDWFEVINLRIRETSGLSNKIKDLTFLAGLYRPESEENEKRSKNSLAYHVEGMDRRFIYIEHLVLPDWQESSCPWCQELNILQGVIKPSLRNNEVYHSRLGALRNVDQGLKGDEALFHLSDDTRRVTLGAESYLGPEHTPISGVVLGAASILQYLRGHPDENKRLAPGFPFTKVLGARNFKNFDEGLIRAALIRATNTNEFGIVEKEKTIRLLSEGFSAVNQKIMFGEYLCAITVGKFPPITEALLNVECQFIDNIRPEIKRVITR